MNQSISTREYEVLYLLAFELNTREIASKLFISPHTVVSHRKKLLAKLGARNTAGLVRVGFERGYLAIG